MEQEAPRTYHGLERMKPIPLEEMDSVKLMNRIDTKYVTDESGLDKLLEMAADQGFMACLIAGKKITPYWSMYYDTDDLEMFRIHRAGHATRQKIRVRNYVSTGVTFLEIKRKNNKGRTKKKRIQIEGPEAIGTQEARSFNLLTHINISQNIILLKRIGLLHSKNSILQILINTITYLCFFINNQGR